MKRFKHINATSPEEAAAALDQYEGKARVIAGGTDILGQMKDNILPDYPEALINLKKIPGLDYIKEEKKSLKIGALTKLEDIANSDTVNTMYPALAEAAAKTASPHIREQGTIAGNICQSNRCWYYWTPDNRFDCIRKDGKRCYAYGGDGRYHSIFGSSRIKDTPCTEGCPANVQIPMYMSSLRQGDLAEAARILMDSNPFPAITGRVCPHTCESNCNRSDLDESVAIRNVERYVGNYVLDNFSKVYPEFPLPINGNIAVVGSGPAGLSCAWYLRKAGYTVTVYDKMDKPGGMLIYGIPEYRLPEEIVDKQIGLMKSAGISFITGPEQGSVNLEEISQNYDAIFVATGAWKDKPIGITGEEHMVSGIEFLRNHEVIGDRFEKKIAVMGGGNVAIDVARTLLRLGATPVIFYRRTRDEMPAIEEEILRAEEEGIEIRFLTLPIAVLNKQGKLSIECTRMKLGEPDESGRPGPEPVTGSEFSFECDAVIKATGEVPDYSVFPAPLLDANGMLSIQSNGLVDGNIFAGGDLATGPSTVIKAITSGRNGAEAIDKYLDGKGIRTRPVIDKTSPWKFDNKKLQPVGRNELPLLSVSERIEHPDMEDVGDPALELVTDEAGRCFNCGCLAVNSSDIAPVLIALNAKIITNTREIAAEEFFTVNGEKTTVLDNEIVTEIDIPLPKTGTTTKFIKFALRRSIDFPIVNCAVNLIVTEGKVRSARICLNAVYNTPYRAYDSEKHIKGKLITELLAEEAGEKAVSDVSPLPDNTYKIQIAKTLVKRAILACAEQQ